MGLLLVILGLILWLGFGLFLLGIICLVVGLVLLFVPGTYGVREWGGRRRAP